MFLFTDELELNQAIEGIVGVRRHTRPRPHASLVPNLKTAGMLNQSHALSRCRRAEKIVLQVAQPRLLDFSAR
jgi:hypothetical protein